MIIIKAVIEVKHVISQRLRFKIKPIRNSRDAADRLVFSVEKITGVSQLRDNLKSASLVIKHDKAGHYPGRDYCCFKGLFFSKGRTA